MEGGEKGARGGRKVRRLLDRGARGGEKGKGARGGRECHACHTKVHGSQRMPEGWTLGGREGARQGPWIVEGRTTPATLK